YTTWAIEILPFIEQNNLYKLYNQAKLNTDSANAAVVQAPIPEYQCPSDTHVGLLETPASGPRASNSLWMHGSYRANSGKVNDKPASNGTPPFRGFWDTYEPYYWPGGVMNKSYRGPLHATASTYNGIPAQTTIDPTTGGNATGQSVAQLGGPERFTNI